MNPDRTHAVQRQSRPLSPVERVFFAFEEVNPPAINQFVLEGSGHLIPEKWQRAVELASAANPGSRLVVRGQLGWTRLVDSGVTPRVRVIHAPDWSGKDPEGADFLREPLSMHTGPSCEVVLLPGDPCRVIFRTHHTSMDGGGTLHWTRDIFHALNGRPLVGSSLGVTDTQLAKSLRTGVSRHWPRIYPSPTGKSENDEDTTTWRRIHIEGKYSMLLPKMALYVAQCARRSPEEKIHIVVPADMRKHTETPPNTGNITGFIHLLVEKDSTPESLSQAIHEQLEQREYATLSPGTAIAPYLPISLISEGLRKSAAKMRKDNQFNTSAILTNLGRLDLSAFCTPEFQPNSGFFIPPCSGVSPAMMATSGSENGLEAVVGMPTGLASGGRIDDFLQNMETFLNTISDRRTVKDSTGTTY